MQSESSPLKLGDLVSLVRGNTYRSALLGSPGPVLLGLASIQRDGGFRGDSLKTYGGDSAEKLLLRPGDLYVSLKDVTQSGDLLGSVARVPTTVQLGRLTQDTVKLQFDRSRYPPDLLYWTLRSPEYRAYCRERAIGTTNLSLSRDDFLAFPLPTASQARLDLVELLEAVEQRIEVLRQPARRSNPSRRWCSGTGSWTLAQYTRKPMVANPRAWPQTLPRCFLRLSRVRQSDRSRLVGASASSVMSVQILAGKPSQATCPRIPPTSA